jgi:hypothetical protein
MSIRNTRAGLTQASLNAKAYPIIGAETAILTAGAWVASRDPAVTIGAFLGTAATFAAMSRSQAVSNVASLLFGTVWAVPVAWLVSTLGGTDGLMAGLGLLVFLIVAGLHMQAFQFLSDAVAKD